MISWSKHETLLKLVQKSVIYADGFGLQNQLISVVDKYVCHLLLSCCKLMTKQTKNFESSIVPRDDNIVDSFVLK